MKTLICSLENNIAPLRKYGGQVSLKRSLKHLTSYIFKDFLAYLALKIIKNAVDNG